jgi:DNA-binding transcriptional regulator YhcF (GntR family)
MNHTTYMDIYTRLRNDIANGTYPAGSVLPTHQALVTRFEVAQMTVVRALGILADEGLIEKRKGTRTRVLRLPIGPPLTPTSRLNPAAQALAAAHEELHRVTAERDALLEDHSPEESRTTASTARELAALRHAMDRLTHKLGAAPAYRPPDRIWIEPVSNNRYGEWDVQSYQDDRILAIRAGIDDGVPGVFLVDRRGDMHALEASHTHGLMEALASGLTYLDRQRKHP